MAWHSATLGDWIGCLPTQEVGIENFGKINSTHTTFPYLWTSFQVFFFQMA
jgi:hypothetical protein